MGLPPKLLRGIYTYGFERPSEIQKRAIKPFTSGKDLVAQAQSGTGKTGAFTIGLLGCLDFSVATTQALVLSPTRELALQTVEVVSAIGKHLVSIPGAVAAHPFVGGTKVTDDITALRNGVYVAVGTPGRVFDVISRRALNTTTLKVLVLDEADEMLSQGFSEQIYDIFRHLPTTIQACLFSATMPDEVLELSKKFLRNPVRILVKKEQLTLEGLKQFYVLVEKTGDEGDRDKLEVLLDLYASVSVAQAVIFCNTRRKVEWLTAEMTAKKMPVVCMHADMSKPDRENVMRQFRSGSARVLISTDLVARGIDVQHVSAVINFDLPSPSAKESYLHRIGRSARYGRRGLAINFVGGSREMDVVKELEGFYRTHIEELPSDYQKYLE